MIPVAIFLKPQTVERSRCNDPNGLLHYTNLLSIGSKEERSKNIDQWAGNGFTSGDLEGCETFIWSSSSQLLTRGGAPSCWKNPTSSFFGNERLELSMLLRPQEKWKPERHFDILSITSEFT